MLSSWASVKCSPFVIVAWVPQLSSMWKIDLKIIQSLLERGQICRRCWKTKEWTAVCSGPTKDSWTTITKKKNSCPGNDIQGIVIQGMTSREWHPVLILKGMSTFERVHFYKFSHYFALWRIYLNYYIWNYFTQAYKILILYKHTIYLTYLLY